MGQHPARRAGRPQRHGDGHVLTDAERGLRPAPARSIGLGVSAARSGRRRDQLGGGLRRVEGPDGPGGDPRAGIRGGIRRRARDSTEIMTEIGDGLREQGRAARWLRAS